MRVRLASLVLIERTEVKVTLIAATKIEMQNFPFIEGTEFERYHALTVGSSADRLAHFAGRACYQSWDMPNSATSTDAGYLANIIKQQHFSVLEHASATFYVEGVSRSLTHELVRHRHLSFSQLSQRYVDMKDAEFVLPPALREGHEVDSDVYAAAYDFRATSYKLKQDYEDVVQLLMSKGYTRKQAREAARAVLPNNMETKIVVTGNHRAWREMLQKRYNVHADAEIRQLATELLRQLRELAPGTYSDFPEEPFK